MTAGLKTIMRLFRVSDKAVSVVFSWPEELNYEIAVALADTAAMLARV